MINKRPAKAETMIFFMSAFERVYLAFIVLLGAYFKLVFVQVYFLFMLFIGTKLNSSRCCFENDGKPLFFVAALLSGGLSQNLRFIT